MKTTTFDTGYERPSDIPITSPFFTKTCAVAGFRNRSAGTITVNWVLLTTVVSNHVAQQ